MDVVRFGLGLRALRRKRGWTQDDLAAKTHVSRTAVWRIERGHADRVAVHVLVRVAAALGARIDVRLLWQGEGLDRLLDAGHADLVDRTLELLSDSHWLVATEVSFNVRGERGSIDILDSIRRPGHCSSSRSSRWSRTCRRCSAGSTARAGSPGRSHRNVGGK